MTTKSKPNQYTDGIKIAEAILSIVTENMHVDHEKKQLEGIVLSSVKTSDKARVKQILDGVARAFNCGYDSRMCQASESCVENGYFYGGYTIYEHEFHPKRITSYSISIKERCSHLL